MSESDIGFVRVCGQIIRSSSQHGDFEFRFVEATRSVQTCDESGCSDAYEETYQGPATDEELLIDITAGVARIRITLSGQSEGDSCTVSVDLTATDANTGGEVWPTFNGRVSPQASGGSVTSGPTTIAADAGPQRVYAQQTEDEAIGRRADGSGSACGWMPSGAAAFEASMQRWKTSSTSHWVTMPASAG